MNMTTNEATAPRKLRPGTYEYKGQTIEHTFLGWVNKVNLGYVWTVDGAGEFKSMKAAAAAIDGQA